MKIKVLAKERNQFEGLIKQLLKLFLKNKMISKKIAQVFKFMTSSLGGIFMAHIWIWSENIKKKIIILVQNKRATTHSFRPLNNDFESLS